MVVKKGKEVLLAPLIDTSQRRLDEYRGLGDRISDSLLSHLDGEEAFLSRLVTAQGATSLFAFAEEFPANRSVAANALMHMGMCHETLGNRGAQWAYQRLILE
jgi:hypothetical protein